jgi:carboxypeptidase T
VDLNRNNGPASTWCSAGSSTNPSSNTYCGPEVFSEPEDRAMTEFLASRQSRLGEPVRAAVDLHTFGALPTCAVFTFCLRRMRVYVPPVPPADLL